MRLPRRVPWASLSELDQVCSWIYADENDLDSKYLAFNRLSAWRSITCLPHALESTQALLAVFLQDNSTQSPSTCLSLRQSYASAVVRLVNGLVDPLQLGAYARSIASIAAQLGLPSWLVELRHAATHEDLPSLDLLREAARESMAWLLHNYFLPTLNPSAIPQSQPEPLRPLAPILKRYKTLLKITIRDTSLQTRYKAEINTALRDIERWVAEAKVAATIAVNGFSWDMGPPGHPDAGDLDIKERWALDRLCDGLLGKGGLVPQSKRKRRFPADQFFPPKFSVALWSPLLTHLGSHHPDLPHTLTTRILSYLLTVSKMEATPDTTTISLAIPFSDVSFDMCLARWVLWIVDSWNDDDPESEFDLRKEAVATLMIGLGPSTGDVANNRKPVLELLQALSKGIADLETALCTLMVPVGSLPAQDWHGEDLDLMDGRLRALLSLQTRSTHANSESQPSIQDAGLSQSAAVTFAPAHGWRLLNDQNGWKACPIGVHVSPTRNDSGSPP